MSGKERILEVLKKHGDVYESELYKLAGLSKSRTAEILKDLEKEGLIRKYTVLGKNKKVSLVRERFLRIGIIKAAEYPFVIPFAKKLKENNIDSEIVIYNNGLQLTKDIVNGKIDLGFSPVIAQIFFSKVFGLEIIAGGAKGGAGIIGNCTDIIGSTELSSMELWTLMSVKDSEIVHFDSPEELINALQTGKVNSISIWEPYYSILARQGKFKIKQPFEPFHCCTLGMRKELVEIKDKIKRIYEDSFTWFKESKDRWISDYSKLLNIDYNILKESANNYEFDSYFNLKETLKTLQKTNIYIP